MVYRSTVNIEIRNEYLFRKYVTKVMMTNFKSFRALKLDVGTGKITNYYV